MPCTQGGSGTGRLCSGLHSGRSWPTRYKELSIPPPALASSYAAVVLEAAGQHGSAVTAATAGAATIAAAVAVSEPGIRRSPKEDSDGDPIRSGHALRGLAKIPSSARQWFDSAEKGVDTPTL